MATRLYLPASTGAPPAVSPAFDASWEATGSAFRGRLNLAKQGSAIASSAVAESVNNTAYDVLVAQFVSEPLSGNQTISAAIKGVIRAQESNAAADMRAQTVIRVVSGDGTTVRGTLIASSGAALASEFATSLTNRYFPLGGSTVPTSVGALDGDRIVVEVGYRSHEASATARTGTLSFGDPVGGADVADNETATTASAPWIEFTDNLVFVSMLRATQSFAEVLVAPTDQKVRVTQSFVEVLYPASNPTTPTSTPRFRAFILG